MGEGVGGGGVGVGVVAAAEEAKDSEEEAMDSVEAAMDSVEAEKATVEVDSPAVDALRHNAGKEYEELLEEMLAAEGIPFVTERDLRADGHARTPDIKLEVPIAVRGRIVNWIDSKASFSDPLVHVEKGVEQFQGYVNRFGPGMVIYWHGIVDELNDE